MRKELLVLIFTALVGAASAAASATPAIEAGAITATAPVTGPRLGSISAGLRDETAAMVILGTVLIGLAAVVRRAA